MRNTIVVGRGKKHFILSLVGGVVFLYLLYSFFSFPSKGKFDATCIILAVSGFLMLIFTLIHAFLAYLMIFRYNPLVRNSENNRVLKVLSYEDEPKKLFVVRCSGRTIIVSEI